MTSKQAIKAMKTKYPGYSVRATVETWDSTHTPEPYTTYTIYAGNETRAHAGGEGGSFQEAFDNCREYEEAAP